MKEAMLTPERFAELKGVHYRTVIHWLRDGKIPGAKWFPHGKGWWNIPASALSMEKPPRKPYKRRAKK